MRVSIDTFDADEIRTAVEAGAELVLSVNGSNLEVARELAGHRRARGGGPRSRRGRSTRSTPSIEALDALGRAAT